MGYVLIGCSSGQSKAAMPIQDYPLCLILITRTTSASCQSIKWQKKNLAGIYSLDLALVSNECPLVQHSLLRSDTFIFYYYYYYFFFFLMSVLFNKGGALLSKSSLSNCAQNKKLSA